MRYDSIFNIGLTDYHNVIVYDYKIYGQNCVEFAFSSVFVSPIILLLFTTINQILLQ